MRPGDKSFPWSHVELAARPLIELEQQAARERMAQGARGVKLLHPGRTLGSVARKFGISHLQLFKIRAIVAAAEADPERFGGLRDEMDRSGKIAGPYKKLVRARDEDRVLRLAPIDGRFRTLVVDPPWDEDNISRSAGHAYALMSREEIFAVPVAAWAAEQCHLYLWATDNTLPIACALVAHWGFQHRSVLTWVKPRFGRGRYFRNSTEHVLFANRGELGTRAPGRSTRTDHRWPVGEDSEKPDGFYALVEACSYPPYGEAFQRKVRPGFVSLYQAAPIVVAAE